MLQMDICETIMKDLGYNEGHRGTKFIREAVRLYKPDGSITELYGRIGQEHGKKPGAVERAIRHANEYMFFNADTADLTAWFGGSINRMTGKMTNGQVIATLWHCSGGDED